MPAHRALDLWPHLRRCGCHWRGGSRWDRRSGSSRGCWRSGGRRGGPAEPEETGGTRPHLGNPTGGATQYKASNRRRRGEGRGSPEQRALSKPEMVKPTSQVHRVEPCRWVQWEGRTELAAGVVVAGTGRGGAGEVVEGEELKALELLVMSKPDQRKGGSVQELWATTLRSGVLLLTSALGLPAAPSQGLKTLPGPRANQLVARLTQEVNLVPDTEHPAKAAAEGWSLRFGAGSWNWSRDKRILGDYEWTGKLC